MSERNPSANQQESDSGGGAFGDTAAQYLANCRAPRLEKPFDKVAFNRVVSERIRLVREGGAGSTGLRSEDNERG